MRFTIMATLLVAFISLTSFTGNNNGNNNNQLIAKARQALKQSCPDAQGTLQASVRVISACFVSGFITEVSFYRTPNCPPNQICPHIVTLIGRVTLGCDDSVMSVECSAPVAQ